MASKVPSTEIVPLTSVAPPAVIVFPAPTVNVLDASTVTVPRVLVLASTVMSWLIVTFPFTIGTTPPPQAEVLLQLVEEPELKKSFVTLIVIVAVASLHGEADLV